MRGDGYTLDRIKQVDGLGQHRDRSDVPRLLAQLKYANQPTPSEQELRLAIYDAISWHQDLEIRERLLQAIREETDEVAAFVYGLVHRQPYLIEDLPELIDRAWRTDKRIARRYLEALVKGDEEGTHTEWVKKNYPTVARELGL